MVKEKTVTWFVCPYCNNRYRDESDAEDCRDNCLDVEAIEEDSDTLYECEICGKEFDDEDNAETHEQEHSEYQEFQDQLKLAEAAEYPEQKKLIEVK